MFKTILKQPNYMVDSFETDYYGQQSISRGVNSSCFFISATLVTVMWFDAVVAPHIELNILFLLT